MKAAERTPEALLESQPSNGTEEKSAKLRNALSQGTLGLGFSAGGFLYCYHLGMYGPCLEHITPSVLQAAIMLIRSVRSPLISGCHMGTMHRSDPSLSLTAKCPMLLTPRDPVAGH